jgi:hypothetical protein
MTLSTTASLAIIALCASLAFTGGGTPPPEAGPSPWGPIAPPPQDPPGKQDPHGNEAAAMAQMMQQAAKFLKPGSHHKELERFVGSWTTETQLFMAGQATPPAKGEAEFAWLMPGRWLKGSSKGAVPMLGSVETFSLLGYDNFKQSFVFTQVTSMDTAMMRTEGDMDQSGKVLIMYGTVDEYLTGEHDKMAKGVYRFASADEMTLEIHDLAIGESNTKVLETRYKRKK